jgi:hypothetical protein
MLFCILYNITTRTSGCRLIADVDALQFLLLGGYYFVTYSCATYAVRVKYICLFPRFKVVNLVGIDKLDTV